MVGSGYSLFAAAGCRRALKTSANNNKNAVRPSSHPAFRVASDLGRYAAPVCDSVIMNVLCGEHNQFAEWLKLIESVGNDLSACATLKARLFDDTATESPAKVIVLLVDPIPQCTQSLLATASPS